MHRLLLALLLTGALGATPALAADSATPAEKADRSADRPAPAAPRTEATQASVMDQGAIFRILCGGLSVAEGPLSNHLWQMAGSLADSSWTPPRVTVRVVVSDPAIR